MSEARKHHYISAFYLRGFSVGKGKHRKIQVARLPENRFSDENPKKVAVVPDFMRVEIEGMQPDGLENALSKFETAAAEAIVRVAGSGSLKEKIET